MDRNRFVIVLMAALLVLNVCAFSYAAEKKSAAPAATPAAAPVPPPAFSFGMVSGSVVSVDNSDPANVKLSVKNEADGTTKTVVVTPSTNITKTTDVSEIKAGEQIRAMTRNADDKYIAMGVMFGKMAMPMVQAAVPAPIRPPMAPEQKAKK